jgi:hypothetical protein
MERGGIPYDRRSGIFDPENGELELPLANAVYQLDTGNRGRGAPAPYEAEHVTVKVTAREQPVQTLAHHVPSN